MQANVFAEPQLTTRSSKACATANAAEAYISKNNSESIHKGIHLLESILQQDSFKRLDIDSKVAIYQILCTGYEKQQEFQKQEKLLQDLLGLEQYKQHHLTLRVGLVRSYLLQNDLENASRSLQPLLQIAPYLLSIKERDDRANVLEWLSKCYRSLISQADALCKEQREKEAIPLYQEVLRAVDIKTFPLSTSHQVRAEYYAHFSYALAYCYYMCHDYAKTIGLLKARNQACSGNSKQLTRLYLEGEYLLGQALEAQGMQDKALVAYDNYLLGKEKASRYGDAAYRMAYLLYLQNDVNRAYSILQNLTHDSGPKHLLLTYIALSQNNQDEARRQIQLHKQTNPQEPSMTYEVLYLDGLILIKDGQINKGIHCIEEALTLVQGKDMDRWQSAWIYDAELALALSYRQLIDLHLATQPEIAQTYLERAFQCIEKISDLRPPIPQQYDKYHFCKLCLQIQLAESLFLNSQSKKAQTVLDSVKTSLTHFIHTANLNLEKNRSFLLDIAAQLTQLNSEPCNKMARSIMSLLPQQDSDLFHYVRIMVEISSHDTEEQILQYITERPQSPYVSSLLHALASLYIGKQDFINAEEAIRLIQYNFPNYEREDHLLYLLAFCLDTDPLQVETARALRKELISSYQDSPYVAESHFRFFPEVEYERGTPHAIDHLKNMTNRYQNSPFTIVAYYYCALYEKREAEKNKEDIDLAGFRRACTLFSQCYHLYQKRISEDFLNDDIRRELYRLAQLSRFHEGKTLLTLAKRENESAYPSIPRLTEAKTIFEDLTASLTPSSQDEMSRRIFFESQYQLAKICELLHFEDPAIKILTNLSKACIQDNYSLYAKAQIALGKLAMKSSRFDAALKQFNRLESEKIAFKDPQLYLKVLIEKSNCFRRMQKFDKAMTLLSQVINNNLASSIRIKAMVMRAEIYELQKRRDLAIKQLESASRYGGEWGSIAKVKLEEIYGID